MNYLSCVEFLKLLYFLQQFILWTFDFWYHCLESEGVFRFPYSLPNFIASGGVFFKLCCCCIENFPVASNQFSSTFFFFSPVTWLFFYSFFPHIQFIFKLDLFQSFFQIDSIEIFCSRKKKKNLFDSLYYKQFERIVLFLIVLWLLFNCFSSWNLFVYLYLCSRLRRKAGDSKKRLLSEVWWSWLQCLP